MQKLRRLPAEGLIELHVFGRRDDPLFGADDVADAHHVIVDHVGQVIGRKAVRLQQHLIVDGGVIDDDPPRRPSTKRVCPDSGMAKRMT